MINFKNANILMLFWIWKKDTIKLLKIYQLQVRIGWKRMKIGLIYLRNNLRLNEISILIVLQNYCKIHGNQLGIIVKATYSLHLNKYFEMLNLTFLGRSLVTSCFGLHSNSRGVDEIKELPISIEFCNRNTEFLLLFSRYQFAISRVMKDFVLVK